MPSAMPTFLARMTPHHWLKVSIVVALLTIVLKTLAWWITDSVGLLSDALESFVNLAGAMFALVMVTVAARPADKDHPFGHHKAEYFSSGFEGILVVGAAAAIFWAAVLRLMHPQPLQQLTWGLGLAMLSAVFNGVLAWGMFRAARTHRSVALEGDAMHLFTDVWTSVGVVLGLVAAGVTGWHWLDPVVALVVAINIFKEGSVLVWKSSQGLMDGALAPEPLARINALLERYARASEGAVRFDSLTRAVRARAASCSCTCMCPRAGRWAARPPSAPRWRPNSWPPCRGSWPPSNCCPWARARSSSRPRPRRRNSSIPRWLPEPARVGVQWRNWGCPLTSR